ncbi:MAG: hypothetical protein WCB86_11230, partial [Candidatus Dormiibacterota bacterium]
CSRSATMDRGPRVAPPWSGPPDHMMPGALPYELPLVASDKTVIWITMLWAYPTGFRFDLNLRLPEPQRHGNPMRGLLFQGQIDPLTGTLGWRPGEEFRFAVTYANGRTVDNHPRSENAPPSAADPPPAAGIELRAVGVTLSPQSSDGFYWLWPLPPPGPIGFFCEWLAMGIDPTVVEVDAGPIREAASRAVELWPPGRPI